MNSPAAAARRSTFTSSSRSVSLRSRNVATSRIVAAAAASPSECDEADGAGIGCSGWSARSIGACSMAACVALLLLPVLLVLDTETSALGTGSVARPASRAASSSRSASLDRRKLTAVMMLRVSMVRLRKCVCGCVCAFWERFSEVEKDGIVLVACCLSRGTGAVFIILTRPKPQNLPPRAATDRVVCSFFGFCIFITRFLTEVSVCLPTCLSACLRGWVGEPR
ncbi:hypothetical protein DFJ73DRAFT_402964, partial [Zopfochytrium polystomum]